MRVKFRLVSRDSLLALAQTLYTADKLYAAGHDVEISTMKTSGDLQLADPLYLAAMSGDKEGKAFFTKELETALLAGQADLAVHSLKDVPTQLPEPLRLTHFFAREDDFDIIVSDQPLGTNTAEIVNSLSGKQVGSSSVRRLAIFSLIFPETRFVNVRGNVQTRLRKLLNKENDITAIVLAGAGLKRFFRFYAYWQENKHQWKSRIPSVLFNKIEEDMSDITTLVQTRWFFYKPSAEFILPASGQGVLGLEAGDLSAVQLTELDATFSDSQQNFETITHERRILQLLEAGCHAPLGLRVQKLGQVAYVSAENKEPVFQVQYFFDKAFNPLGQQQRFPRSAVRLFQPKSIEVLAHEILTPDLPVIATSAGLTAREKYDEWLPLTVVKQIKPQGNQQDSYEFAVISSASCLPGALTYLKNPRIISVPGKATAAAVRSLFPQASVLISPEGTGKSAAQMLLQKMSDLTMPVLWAGAREGNKDGIHLLSKAGYSVHEYELYEHVENDYSVISRKFESIKSQSKFNYSWWVFTSPQAVKIYLKHGFYSNTHYLSCIGTSTAKVFFENRIIPHHISSYPDKELQLREIKGIFDSGKFEIAIWSHNEKK